MTKITILDNKYCRIQSDNLDFLKALKTFLSFRLVGVEYTQAYKNGWSGFTFLLNKNGTFMSGLFPKVLAFCKKNEVIPEIIDKREKLNNVQEIDLTQRLKDIKKEPRDYQLRILDAAINNDKGIIRACTASGKTLVAALITAKFNKPTIIYVIGLNLLSQFHQLFSEVFDEPIGIIGNGTCDIQRFNIASVWTMSRALGLNTKELLLDQEENLDDEKFDEGNAPKIIKLLSEAKIHIIDESHVVTVKSINHIYKIINPERIYGLSGTPFRDDNSDLLINGILGEQIVNVTASELIEKKVLAKPYIRFFTVPKAPIDGRTYQSVYKEYIVESPIRNHLIVNQTKNLLEKGYAPLVLFKIVNHGKILFDLFKTNNIKCEMLYGNDNLEKRLEIIELFNNGDIDVILASSIFELGVDISKISALINASGSKSTIKTLQKVGRCIRPYPGKTHVAVVDFYDQCRYLKDHSKKRFKIYSSEPGFEVFASKEMSHGR